MKLCRLNHVLTTGLASLLFVGLNGCQITTECAPNRFGISLGCPTSKEDWSATTGCGKSCRLWLGVGCDKNDDCCDCDCCPEDVCCNAAPAGDCASSYAPAPAANVAPPEPLPMPKPPPSKSSAAPGAPVGLGPQAELTVTKSGPAQRHVGKTLEHLIQVQNTGTAPATGIELVDHVPDELSVEETPADATVNGQEVRWDLGDLLPDASKSVTLKTRARRVSPHVSNRVTATSKDATEATAAADLEITGSSAVLLEVFDLVDPVPEGGETEYLLRVTNQGHLTLHGLRLEADCPKSLKPVSVTNSTPGTRDGRTVCLPAFELLPGGSRTFRLKVQAVKADDARMTIRLTGQELTSPVVEEESTRVFAATESTPDHSQPKASKPRDVEPTTPTESHEEGTNVRRRPQLALIVR